MSTQPRARRYKRIALGSLLLSIALLALTGRMLWIATAIACVIAYLLLSRCPRCRAFQETPGSSRCARCGALLG